MKRARTNEDPRRPAQLSGLLLLGCAWLSGCGAPPPKPEPLPPPNPRQDEPATNASHELTALPNGLGAFLAIAPEGATGQLQLGVLAGSLFEAPGLAELAAITVVRSNNPAQGQRSLEQAIERLGGTLDIRVGLMATWIDLRVPSNRLWDAVKLLRTALESPTTSRNQIERLRDELVAQHAREALAEPLRATSRATLLAERSTASYLDGLLDIDPGQVGLLHSRLYRPERCLLSVRWDQPHRTMHRMLEAEGSIAGWRAPPPVPGDISLLSRRFETRLMWHEQGAPGSRARIAVVLPLPQQGDALAAGLLVMHACLTLDGTGGRFERLQNDAGLGHLQWQARYEQAPDSHALVLTTTATPTEAVRVWQVLQNARQSLIDVPPSPSEIQLALRRARLNASLPMLDGHARLRTTANLALAGKPVDVVERRLDVLAADPAFDYGELARAFVQKPYWMAVVGPDMPAGVAGLESFKLIPDGFELPEQGGADTVATETNDPWLDRAQAASGLPSDFESLRGFEAVATRTASLAPPVEERISWRQDGTLTRERTVLGSVVTTTLDGDSWTEELDGARKGLSVEQADELRREMRRHPMMILAAVRRGELRFRPIAQREVGDRQLMVLEAVQERTSRLRVHVDVASHLIRAVEVWEQVGESIVHIHEEWSDYRKVGTLRVPHRCDVSWNDGEHRTRLAFASWTPN